MVGLMTFGRPRFLCCHEFITNAERTGTSSHWPSLPRLTQRLHGRPTSHAKCARLHGPHADDTFALPPARRMTICPSSPIIMVSPDPGGIPVLIDAAWLCAEPGGGPPADV